MNLRNLEIVVKTARIVQNKRKLNRKRRRKQTG